MRTYKINARTLAYIGKKYNNLLVIGIGKVIRNTKGFPTQYFVCKCDCGIEKEISSKTLGSGKVKSCGCIRSGEVIQTPSKHIGKKFGRLLVIDDDKRIVGNNGKRYRLVVCRCDCGKRITTRVKYLLNKDVRSCGCLSIEKQCELKNNLAGQRFGKLLVISRHIESPPRPGRVMYNVVCDCGNTNIVIYDSLTTGHTKTCGNCELRRNGVLTSWIALKLNDMIPSGLHNYFTDIPSKNGKTLNVDIALPDEKIAIEYDCLYWHNTKESKDRDTDKTNLLVENGWKVLRIISDYKLPNQTELDNHLNELKTTNKKVIIVRLD